MQRIQVFCGASELRCDWLLPGCRIHQNKYPDPPEQIPRSRTRTNTQIHQNKYPEPEPEQIPRTRTRTNTQIHQNKYPDPKPEQIPRSKTRTNTQIQNLSAPLKENTENTVQVYRVQVYRVQVYRVQVYRVQVYRVQVYRVQVYRVQVYRVQVYRVQVYRVQVYRVQVYRVQVYRVQVYRVQVYRVQLSGAEKPPAGEPENNTSAAAAGSEASADGGSKVEMVFWLLSMLANRDKEEMSRTLLALSSSQDSCIAMRKSGCVPLLVQILHEAPGTGSGPGETSVGGSMMGCSREAKSRASAALHNIIYSQQDEGQARREMRVLHMLEQIRTYCDSGWDWIESHAGTPSPAGTKTTDIPEPVDPQICQAMCAIMKLSFEEEYRRAMNELGGLQAVADLIHLDQDMYGMQNDPINMALRRYAGMAVTNLTFGDVVNKVQTNTVDVLLAISNLGVIISLATLCSKKSCLQALVAQLASDSEELHQVVSSILRNLSWRADISSKRVLRDIGCVSALMTCALQATKESTLKSLLSALWNLSAHSIDNKVAICSVDGALGFLVSTLTYRCQTNSLAIIESGGGILRNVSSLVATREDYRQILRDHNCLHTLLQHLRSAHSLTIVSNACGTLWNLSARSPKDQELLWDLGAVSMLRNLIHSKHKMIAMGSAAALRNLLTNRPLKYKDAAVVSPGSCMPSLYMRKQKALEAELDAKHLAETFDTLDKQSPKHLTLNKPLRHIESLAKDYASDSGCFDDDEAPNVSSSLDTGSFSMLSMFLTNSNFLQNQPRKRDKKLAKKITNTVAKIDRLVEDITMHTSSEDSFSLSSEDHLADWPERLSRAHALLRLKTAHTSVSTDSLNSGSTSDGYCGSKDQMRPVPRALMMQQRPNQLDLKVAHQDYLNLGPAVLNETNQQDIPERDSVDNKDVKASEFSSTDAEKNQDQPVQHLSVHPLRSPTIGTMETVQKYSVENTPICFSRCSSLSSLSSGDGALDGQSENELESDSSLEIIEVEDEEVWENSLRKFMEIADSKERFNLPPDLDTMIYFTVEKPTENFSCASSLSALPLHEHYIQKDVELKLTPLLQQNDKNLPFPDEDEQGLDQGERYSEGNSDDDIEILKECINSAMPSKFRKVRPSLMTTIPPHILNARNPIHLPVYMMLPNGKTQMCPGRRIVIPQKDFKFDDSSFTDSAEGTPVNFSSTTSLSDETLQYPVKDRGAKDCTAKGMNKQELVDDEAKRIEDLRIFSHFHKPNRMNYPPEIQMNRATKHVIPTQRVLMQSKERRKLAARKKKAENTQKQKQKSSDGWNMDEEMDSDDTAWDKDSDLNSVEWRAIQEGANCVVTGLQASKSQEPSSEETESVLSFMSTSSFTPKERKFAKEKKANKPLDFVSASQLQTYRWFSEAERDLHTEKRNRSITETSSQESANQELKVAVQTQKRVQVKGPGQAQQVQRPDYGQQKQTTTLSRATSSERDLSARRPGRRTSSESPCRVAQRNGPGRVSAVRREQQDKDTFKRHASSPSINILSRVTSRSSLRSSSSDSSGRAKSEDDTKKKGQRSASRINDRVTWRRIRDEDVPQILKSTLPANALPLVPSPDGEKPKPPALPGKLPTILLASRKTSDATVQTEDFSNKTNSSTSPTVDAPVTSEEVARLALLRKISATSGGDGDSDGSLRSHSTVSTGTSDSHVGGVVHFRQGSPSKAARVTPFNYTPSPMVCCLQDAESQAATINEKSRGKMTCFIKLTCRLSFTLFNKHGVNNTLELDCDRGKVHRRRTGAMFNTFTKSYRDQTTLNQLLRWSGTHETTCMFNSVKSNVSWSTLKDRLFT
ncbi:Adenomatous polyposis coli protein 2 [Collichthys lucidus]|uniref:Adenomatous polyposis coli protein 2 n=1 Tax=Collichthys lucidus TaxID=240159 RepID=A0A4U5UK69_COLLU|nr:Adenomatous polyposis coli protein 2 [Collichthys lucidus]